METFAFAAASLLSFFLGFITCNLYVFITSSGKVSKSGAIPDVPVLKRKKRSVPDNNISLPEKYSLYSPAREKKGSDMRKSSSLNFLPAKEEQGGYDKEERAGGSHFLTPQPANISFISPRIKEIKEISPRTNSPKSPRKQTLKKRAKSKSNIRRSSSKRSASLYDSGALIPSINKPIPFLCLDKLKEGEEGEGEKEAPHSDLRKMLEARALYRDDIPPNNIPICPESVNQVKKRKHLRSFSVDKKLTKGKGPLLSLHLRDRIGITPRKKGIDMGKSRQEIYVSAVKMGWVRVQTFTFREKHALWSKRFMILCPGELHLMKSQELFAECTHHIELEGYEYRVTKRKGEKGEKGEISLYPHHDLRESVPALPNEKTTYFSFKNELDDWIEAFSKCCGISSLPNPTSLLSPSGEDLSLDLSALGRCTTKKQVEIQWNEELSKRTRVKLPTAAITESVFLYIPTTLSWPKHLMKLQAGIIHFYCSVDKNISLQSMVYLANCSIIPLDRNHQEMPSYSFDDPAKYEVVVLRIMQENNKNVLSRYKQSGERLPVYFDSNYIDIQFQSPSILKASAEALRKAISLQILPLESLVPLTPDTNEAIYRSDIKSVSASIDKSSYMQSEEGGENGFNAVVARYFLELQYFTSVHDKVKSFIQDKMEEVAKPDYIGDVHLSHFDISNLSCQILRSTFCSASEIPLRVIGNVEVCTSGSMEAQISTALNLNFLNSTLAAVPVTATIHISDVLGRFYVYIPEDMEAKKEIFFAELPSYDLSIEFQIAELGFSFVNVVPRLKSFLEDAIREIIRDHVVYPNKITFTFPFPGSSMKWAIERVSDMAMYRPTTGIDSFEEAISRFFVEIIQSFKVEIISDVFTEDCVVSGFSPDEKEFLGFDGVEEIAQYFQMAFADLYFDITEVFSHGHKMHLNWTCSGEFCGSFWERHDPNRDTITLAGSMSLSCIYIKSRAKIEKINFSWSPGTWSKLMKFPTNKECL